VSVSVVSVRVSRRRSAPRRNSAPAWRGSSPADRLPIAATWSAVVTGFGLAALIAAGGWRAGSLSRSGAVAALLLGGVAMTAGRPWGLFLVAWFITATLASRFGRRTKEMATGDVVAKGGRRDATQVLANGGVFALCALLSLLGAADDTLLRLLGAGALVAAGADTLATETGTLWRRPPWSLRSWNRVPTGTSGAVSLPGTVGMVLGAGFLAAVAQLAGLTPPGLLFHVAIAGIGGAVADTLIGAWWQTRRWCPGCARETEQDVHGCGTATQPWRGIAWLDNDAVNFACTVVGAALMGVQGAS
jgi:uncharacterized protein (TIGR00297 family)